MNVGMLWFDNDVKSDLPSKVSKAADYYQGKYGEFPNICFVHPSTARLDPDQTPEVQRIMAGDIEVRLTKSVLPHHFWLGTQIQAESLVR